MSEDVKDAAPDEAEVIVECADAGELCEAINSLSLSRLRLDRANKADDLTNLALDEIDRAIIRLSRKVAVD